MSAYYVTNAEARAIMAIPAEERTADQEDRLAFWMSVEPEHD